MFGAIGAFQALFFIMTLVSYFCKFTNKSFNISFINYTVIRLYADYLRVCYTLFMD